MNWSELEAISLVNLYGGYNEAAKGSKIHVSLLSKRVANVENDLDLKLFRRMTRKNSIVLTSQGEALMPLFQQMLNTRASMLNQAKAYLNLNEDSIAVGVSVMLGDLGAGRLMSDFFALHPHVRMTTIIKSQAEIMRLLSEGVLDCAFICVPEGTAFEDYWKKLFASKCEECQLTMTALAESREMWVGISEKDTVTQKESVTLEELRYHCFIFNRWGENEPADFFAGFGANAEDYETSAENFLNKDYIYRMVAKGAGVLPRMFYDKQPIPGIKFLRMENWTGSSRALFVARGYGGPLRQFAQFVKESAEQEQKG